MFDVRPKRSTGRAQNKFAVIPTPEKLNADQRFTGRGVRIAFLDSGFYPHPDIADRIVAYVDISGEEQFLNLIQPNGRHWHGTQTTVTCAGDGRLSNGVYKGLASGAELVLVKVSRNGRISDETIEAGLKWVIANREKYNIGILNISLGGDCDVSTRESTIDQLAEKLVSEGVVVTVAAGNSADRRPTPPATSPSAITVGGYSDENQFSADGYDLYHSSYGETADGTVKPELIAPAMYVAAPIPPRTKDYEIAEALSMLASVPDYAFRPLLEEFHRGAGLGSEVLEVDDREARAGVEEQLRRRKIVANHYQHVDGTSFAGPIAASVVAQMLEANPALTPAAVKNILMSTATRLSGKPAIRQGFGMLNAKAAVGLAITEKHVSHADFGPPRIENSKVLFSFHDDAATSVRLVGDLNDWGEKGIDLRRSKDGMWQARIPRPPAGNYHYKFLIDGTRWTEDPGHGFKTEDGFGGFNSVLTIG